MRAATALTLVLAASGCKVKTEPTPEASASAPAPVASASAPASAAPAALDPAEIKRLREANKVSQPVFARYLNTSESTVAKWESGAKKPGGATLKLLSVVAKHGLGVLA